MDGRAGTGHGVRREYDLACIARYERAGAAVQGEQVIAIAAFVETYVSDYEVSYRAAEPGSRNVRPTPRSPWPSGSSNGPAARVATACELVERLPATVAAMRAGQVTLPRARVLLEETVHLNSEQRLVVEETLLPKAPALTPGNLRRSTRRLVEKIDAAAFLKRTAAAKADRWVRWWELPDGMAELCAQLPAQDAAAISGVIDELAHAARAPGDPSSIEQIRADAFVDAILRPADLSERVHRQRHSPRERVGRRHRY
ncbi:MAG TPA: DUF222 domain-containing protein [Sporichthyaceae bacterium]|nr:DUF222 domain-containing protein [Sporichthyaceae bacterium]